MAVNKVVVAGNTLIDLTGDTVAKETMLTGATAHDKSGTKITGTCTFDVDSTDATAQVAEILAGKTAYARGSKITGTMPDRTGASGTIDEKDTVYTIPQGYHDGTGKVLINSTEQAKLIPANIKQGVEILGVTGELEPSSEVTAHAKTVTPTMEEQVVLPDAGKDYLSQVTVTAIPYNETQNSAGGTTVTIAG